ncbi:monocarboxylate transporter 12-like isoform X2 [Ruditapes philippinarum]|nr:monocarboxylate transporter 12-like isoform X2 [Ruditapes philippinarum]
MLDHFSAGSGNTAWIGSITWFLLQVLAPLANFLSRRYSFRTVSFTGGLMVGCGYFLSGFVTRIELMYLTFMMIGIGYCLSTTCSAIIISLYFKKRRTLANGVMYSSGGIAVLSFPSLYRFLIDKYGLSQALWVIGAFLSNICVASFVFRQPNNVLNYQNKPLQSNDAQVEIEESIFLNLSDETNDQQRKLIERCCNALNLNFCLFKNRRFSLLVLAFTICSFGQTNNYILIPAHIKTLGYSNTYITIGVSIIGGAELIGRIAVGWFADLNFIQKKYIFVVCMFIGGVFALISPLFDSFMFMAVYAGVTAAFPSSFLALTSVLAIERVGMKNFEAAYSIMFVCMSIPSLICQPIAGWMADYYGSWYPAFILTGIILIFAGAILLIEPFVNRYDMGKTYSFKNVDKEMASPVKRIHLKAHKQNKEDSAIELS